MEIKKRILTGIICAIVAGSLWGISGSFGQLFFRDYQVNPLWITSTRLVVAGIILLVVSFSRDHSHFFEVWKTKKNIPMMLFYAFGGVFSVQYFYYVSISLSNSATATILQYVAPVFIMLYFLLFRGQIPKLKSVIYVFLAMLGVFLMITNGNIRELSISPMALFTGLLAAVAVVVYSVVPRPLLDQYGALNITGWGMILAGIGSNIFYPVWEIHFHVDFTAVIYTLIISIIGTAIAFLLLLRANQLISPLVVSVATATEPLTAVFISIFFFGMKLSGIALLAIILVIGAVILLSRTEQS